MATATVAQLVHIIERVGSLIAVIEPAHWHLPTPCPEWDVQTLVRHLALGNAMVTSALVAAPMTSSDLRAGFDESADTLITAFEKPGVLDRLVDVPFGRVPGELALHLRLTELLVHGWDLARALHRPVGFAADVVEQELAHTAPMLAALPPASRPFAAAVSPASDAAALDRLAAALGRQ
ncbi:TIGR03086 family metal-binding protein [Actinoplanes sp. NPDC051859]|uniref:TIGR03086 family metal-binding protein n=1 Tax=Actinoplanes sp. NPDC051859 TaxID=3363909 RepID=UPI003789D0EC